MKKTKKILSIILSLCMLLTTTAGLESSVLAATNPYPTQQDVDGDGLYEVPCTYYCWQQANSRLGLNLPSWGNGGQWLANAKSSGYSTGTTAKANSIAVWQDSGYGHVAYVLSVDSSEGTMTFCEGGRTDLDQTSSHGVCSSYTLSSSVGSYRNGGTQKLVGFVYLSGSNNNTEMTTPVISIPREIYYVGDTVDLSWSATSSQANFKHYWVIVKNTTTGEKIKDGATGGSGDVTKNSYSFTLSSVGEYSVTVYAVPNDGASVSQKVSTATFEANTKDMTTPTLHMPKDEFCVGEHLSFYWDMNDYDTDFYQYWLVIKNTTTGETLKGGATGGARDVTPNQWELDLSTAGEYVVAIISVPYYNKGERQKSDRFYFTVNSTHKSVDVGNRINATCTSPGKLSDTRCSVCGKSLSTGGAIPALGHNVVTDKAVPATCTTTGLTEGSHCSVCNAVIKAQTTVNATGHTIVTKKAVPATCTTTGLTEGSYCSVCNAVIREQTIIQTIPHNYVNGICSACGKIEPSSGAEDCTHQWNNAVVTKRATCTENGAKLFTCDKCGETKQEIIIATGHNYTENITKPTCTENGYTVFYCSACGDSYTSNYVLSQGHKYQSKTIDPTCEQNGSKDYLCSVCGDNYSEIIPATGHNYITTITKATATADGKIVKECSDCGVISTTTIKKVSTTKLSAINFVYDGKVKSPTLTVKDSAGKALVKGTDYTVSTPSGRKNVGKYTYKIAFKGNYSGTKSLSFTIAPKGTTISSLAAASKGFTVKWKKQATQTTGYQIQYSTSSKFTSSKTITVTKNSTVSQKITKLTGKKKYYVRIRTYKTVSGTKYYSSWSAAKTVTTKK